MDKKSFLQAGHTPTLLAAFLYFDLAFMVWVVLGPLGIQIAADLQLPPAQKGFMVATPLLAGAFLRVVMGLLVDHLKPKKAGAVGQVIVMAALAVAWHFGIHSYEQVLILGIFLGVAGAAFAVALPLASRWYPPEHQGKAMGIAGAGNSGTALAALFAPALASAFGWTNVFGLLLLPLGLVFVVYLVFAKDAPNCPPAQPFSDYFKVLRDKDAWWFMLFYGVTFGGFSGLASSLAIYFNAQYGLDPKTAGYFTAGCVFADSLVRPLGCAVADRICGTKVTAPARATASELRVGAAARQRTRISVKPSCTRGVRISVRITATQPGARPARFARTYRVDRGPAVVCPTRAKG